MVVLSSTKELETYSEKKDDGQIKTTNVNMRKQNLETYELVVCRVVVLSLPASVAWVQHSKKQCQQHAAVKTSQSDKELLKISPWMRPWQGIQRMFRGPEQKKEKIWLEVRLIFPKQSPRDGLECWGKEERMGSEGSEGDGWAVICLTCTTRNLCQQMAAAARKPGNRGRLSHHHHWSRTPLCSFSWSWCRWRGMAGEQEMPPHSNPEQLLNTCY